MRREQRLQQPEKFDSPLTEVLRGSFANSGQNLLSEQRSLLIGVSVLLAATVVGLLRAF